MKRIIISIFVIIAVAGSYALGYFHAVTESVPLLSLHQAQASLVTAKLIEDNKINKAMEFNISLVEDSLKSIEEIEREKEKTINFPAMAISYKKSFYSNEETMKNRKEKVVKDFSRLQEKKPNNAINRTENTSVQN